MQRIYQQQFGQFVFVTEKAKGGTVQPARMTVRTRQSQSGGKLGGHYGGGTVTAVSLGFAAANGSGIKAVEFGAVNN